MQVVQVVSEVLHSAQGDLHAGQLVLESQYPVSQEVQVVPDSVLQVKQGEVQVHVIPESVKLASQAVQWVAESAHLEQGGVHGKQVVPEK